MDGLESEPFADVAPYIFEDLGRAYAVVKKQYRNTDLKKHVIGLNLVEIHSLDSVYQKFTWPMWRALKNYRYFHFIGVVRRHYRAFTRRSVYDVW
ncbi:hypothetical protein CIK92_12800 [Prevotella sp. P4-67]|uniref:hypothetical protein n=1 Tax=Prevotella sp. P4-67 TaxID=2024227 RepID=UPI000B96C1EA|nr:hypothetical protein [Prevotella sp. P4-67]OYP68996.1 hypothetical protein CIK92_12800 [Prevotella sp. P4-67]